MLSVKSILYWKKTFTRTSNCLVAVRARSQQLFYHHNYLVTSARLASGSNWRLVCNHWQNSRHIALFPGCRFCTHRGWKGHKPSSCVVGHTHVRETPRRVESLRVLVVGLCGTIWRMCACSSTCWGARSDATWALGSVPHSRYVLNTLENALRSGILHIRNRRLYFSTAAVALPSQKRQKCNISAYSAFVKMCGILHNVPIIALSTFTTANWRFTPIYMLHAVAQCLGREGQSVSETGIGHIDIYTFCLEWPSLWPTKILTFPPGRPCIHGQEPLSTGV